MKAVLKTAVFTAAVLLGVEQAGQAEVSRYKFTTPSAYLVVEVLDDDLVHFEVSAVGSGPPETQPLYTSPMVFRTNYRGPSPVTAGPGYDGPSAVTRQNNIIETPHLRIEVDTGNLCVGAADKTRQNAHLTTVCPVDLNQGYKGLNIDPAQIRQVYGLGQQFVRWNSADGDWLSLGSNGGPAARQGMTYFPPSPGRDAHYDLGNAPGGSPVGNGFQGFGGGMNGNVQLPVIYAVGDGTLNYALLLDNVYFQRWDFTRNWWEARMYGDQLRFYIISGANLPSLRAAVMDLTGRPPVPPRKAFGLWVSEFGYHNWDRIRDLAFGPNGLRTQNFPVDGFVLDLFWFGGIGPTRPNGSIDTSQSFMGRLDWEQNGTDGNSFPAPGNTIRGFADQHVGIAAIEESYLANTPRDDTYVPMGQQRLVAYQQVNGLCDRGNADDTVDTVPGFWGTGRMIDWSDPAAGTWVHDNRRHPNLVMNGVTVHWTDLGEPETFVPGSCFYGAEPVGNVFKSEQSDIHNLYNLLWNASIWEGYYSHRGMPDGLGRTNPRPFVLSRSGSAGTQRNGAAMWSGDIASRLEVLATHFNAQMHMSLSGIDYYGADIGGFRREAMPCFWLGFGLRHPMQGDCPGRGDVNVDPNNPNAQPYLGYQDEIYTQWFANGAWFDVPVRPHTDNTFLHLPQVQLPTAPNRIGHVPSNLANLRQRYELIPYYYSLAYNAYLNGEPLVPPLVFFYQDDPNVRGMGNEKLIGRDLLVGVMAGYGEYQRNIYLPKGRWYNYHSNEWVDSNSSGPAGTYGTTVANVPEYRDGLLRIPVYARAGAILPQMYVDDATLDAFGNRASGSAPHDELIVRVFADGERSQFTLYEDDGVSLQYDGNHRPLYRYRTTALSQQQTGNTVTVTIAGAVNAGGAPPFPGAVNNRRNVVRLVVNNAQATAVALNGTALPQLGSQSAFDAADSGWYNAGNNLILAKSPAMDVSGTDKTFVFTLQPVTATSSVNFVCDRAFTVPGQSVYVVGTLPALGGPNWDTGRAVKLDPSVYWQYITDRPQNFNLPGPTAPVWTGVISGLPADTAFEWRCIIRNEDGSGQPQWQPGGRNTARTTASGYAGQSYGTF